MKESLNFFSRLFDEFRGRYEINDLKETFFYILFLKHYNNSARFVPEQCNWKYLEAEINSRDFLLKMMTALRELEKLQPQLDQVFDDFELPVTWSYQKFENVIRTMFRYISEIPIYMGRITFEQFFEEMLVAFDLSIGNKSGSLIQPAELTNLMHSFIPSSHGIEIYNPFAGTGSLAIGLDGSNNYFGVEQFRKNRALGQIRLLVQHVPNQKIVIGNALYNLKELDGKQFDIVLFNPPFNLKLSKDQEYYIHSQLSVQGEEKYLNISNATSYIINHCFNQVKNGGKMILVVPNNFLFSAARNDVSLRTDLLNRGQIETIIALPSKILSSTQIPINLVVLAKTSHSNKVCLVNARECFIEYKRTQNRIDVHAIKNILSSQNSPNKRFVEYEEICENEFSLLPDRYLFDNENELDLLNTVELNSIVKFRSPIRLSGSVKAKKIGIKELSDNPDSYLLDLIDVEKSVIQNNVAALENRSLLLANKGEKLKPTFYKGEEQDVFYTFYNIFTFEVIETMVLLDYLIPELQKDYVTSQLKKFRAGAGVPSIRREDLLSIRIKLPTLEQQNKIVAKERQERFQASLKELGFENEIARLRREQKEDLRSKKHNILQHMNNVKSSADALVHFMRKNNGKLNAEDVISPKLKVTVEKRFERLLESLGDAIYFVDNLTNDLTFGNQTVINLNDLINVCIEKGLQSDAFEIKLKVDSDSFIESDIEIKPLIKLSESDFFEFYNNIVENAINHGFTADDKHYILLIELLYSLEEKKIVLRFSNNGTPFAKGMSARYGIKGEKAGKTGNKGYGAWKIIEIVKYWNAEYKVIDLPKEQFPVGLEFKFNLEVE